jgi:hypothetical protein
MSLPNRRVAMVSSLACVVLGTSAANAQDSFIVGPRALGMGGANVASTDDQTAQFYNPAAFGFFRQRSVGGERIASDNNDIGRKRWGFGFDGGAGEQVHGDMGQYLDDLAKVDDINSSGINTQQDVLDLVKVGQGLAHIAENGNALSADVNGGVGVRIGAFGLGLRTYFQGTGRVDQADFVNIGFSTPITDADVQSGGATGDGTRQVLTPAQIADLGPGGGNANLNATSIDVIDFYIRQQGLENDPQAVQLLVDSLVASNTGGGSFTNNQTRVIFRGFGVAEVPLTYGLAINEHLSVGGSLKLMLGRVYGTTVRVFDDAADDVMDNARDNYKQSVNVGVDLGVMARLPMLQVGLIGRNLNSPTFSGPSVYDPTFGTTTRFSDVRIDPQATLGVAFMPWTTLTLEVDCDLNEAQTTLPGFSTQRLGGGIEWNAAHVIALRAGAYKNLAESDVPFVITGGLGFNLYLLRLDLAAAMSPEQAEYEGEDIPKEARFNFGLTVDF